MFAHSSSVFRPGFSVTSTSGLGFFFSFFFIQSGDTDFVLTILGL